MHTYIHTYILLHTYIHTNIKFDCMINGTILIAALVVILSNTHLLTT